MVEEPDNHTIKILRQLRREQAETASALARLIRNSEDRLTRQMSILRDDLETTIKMEIGGSLAHLEIRLEDRIDERIEELKRDSAPS